MPEPPLCRPRNSQKFALQPTSVPIGTGTATVYVRRHIHIRYGEDGQAKLRRDFPLGKGVTTVTGSRAALLHPRREWGT
jgi:hypothetical protein